MKFNKMIIGLVLPNTPNYSETFFNSKIQGLQEAGFCVIVFAANRDRQPKSYQVVEPLKVEKGNPFKQINEVLKLIKFVFQSPKRFFRFWQKERKEKNRNQTFRSVFISAHILPYNLDWLHFGFATMGINRENVGKVIGAKCGVSLRGYDISNYPLKHPGCYQKLWSTVDKVHSLSKALIKKARNTGLSKETTVHIIPPALDPESIPFKKSAGQLNAPIRILSIGRLSWQKGFEYGLNALKQLNDSGIDFYYQIIGDGVDYERLKFAAYQTGLHNKVEFLGRLSHQGTIKQMQQADIYLQPSVQEGFCNAVQEAQAVGLLCIVSDAEGLSENILDKETGFVVPRREPSALKAQILDLINRTLNERKEITFKASNRIREQFCLDTQKEQFKKFYEE